MAFYTCTNKIKNIPGQPHTRTGAKGIKYLKAGVILSGLVSGYSVQANQFESSLHPNDKRLMEMIDNVNFSMRNDVIKFARSGTKRDWKMRQEMRSPGYTTRWEELYEVK